MNRLPSTAIDVPAPCGRLVLFVVATGLVFAYFGWVDAHAEIAHECSTLGGFTVGSEAFVCRQAPAVVQGGAE